MDVVAVVGAGQNSGKTTAVESLVIELKSRGLKVGTIKQVHEQGFSIDRSGTDSWRHAKAGADVVILASPNEVAVIKKISGKNRFQESMKLLGGQGLDIVVVEGNPGVDVPMVYATRMVDSEQAKPVDANVVCIVSLTPDNIQEAVLPVYHLTKDVSKVADLVLKELD